MKFLKSLLLATAGLVAFLLGGIFRFLKDPLRLLAVTALAVAVWLGCYVPERLGRPIVEGKVIGLIVNPEIKIAWKMLGDIKIYENYLLIENEDDEMFVIPRDKIFAIQIAE